VPFAVAASAPNAAKALVVATLPIVTPKPPQQNGVCAIFD